MYFSYGYSSFFVSLFLENYCHRISPRHFKLLGCKPYITKDIWEGNKIINTYFFSMLLIWKMHNISAWYIVQSIFYLVCWYATLTFHLSKGPRAWLCKTVYICKCSKQGNEAKCLQFLVFFSHEDRTIDHVKKTEAFCQKVEWEMKWSQSIFFCLFECHREALSIPCLSFFVCSSSYTL